MTTLLLNYDNVSPAAMGIALTVMAFIKTRCRNELFFNSRVISLLWTRWVDDILIKSVVWQRGRSDDPSVLVADGQRVCSETCDAYTAHFALKCEDPSVFVGLRLSDADGAIFRAKNTRAFFNMLFPHGPRVIYAIRFPARSRAHATEFCARVLLCKRLCMIFGANS